MGVQTVSIFDVIDSFFYDVYASTPSVIYDTSFPPLNFSVNEETKDLKFEFALAGYKKEEIDITFEGDKFTIELKPVIEDSKWILKQKKIVRANRKVSYKVPESFYDFDNTDVNFVDGLLTIIFPAKEKTKPRKIEIK